MSGYEFQFDTTVTAEGNSPVDAVLRLFDRLESIGLPAVDQDGNQRQIVVGCRVAEVPDLTTWSTHDTARWHASTHITDKGVVQA